MQPNCSFHTKKIDEMSMLGADILYRIHYRLSEDIFQSKEPFGGISVLLVGDLLQLPPVNGTPIFKEPKGKKNRDYYNIQPTPQTISSNL